MNIILDHDLAKRLTSIARNNGISTIKYVNNLVESALRGEGQLARDQVLCAKRYKAVERAWENYKFPKDISIEASNGWECVSTPLGSAYFTRVFFYSKKSNRLPTSSKGTFKVGFENAKAKPGMIAAYDEDGNPL